VGATRTTRGPPNRVVQRNSLPGSVSKYLAPCLELLQLARQAAIRGVSAHHNHSSEKAAEDVGFYYAANATGRLTGIILSGLLYQIGGMTACLTARRSCWRFAG
jgi:hypothetical protein